MADFEERLARETEDWAREGLVTPEQAAAIRARHATGARPLGRGRLTEVLSVIGATAVGLGVILFFAANWSGIPRPARLALIVAALLGAYAGGDRLRASLPRTGHALIFLGGLLFGASLFLVGQMYNVQAHSPLAFLVWAAAAAAMAVTLDSAPFAGLATLTFGAWIAYELANVDRPEAIPVVLAIYGAALYAAGTRLRLGLTEPPRRLGYAIAAFAVYALTFHFDLGFNAPHGIVAAVVAALVAALGACAFLALDRGRRTARYEAAACAVTALAAAAILHLPAAPVIFNVVLVALALGAIVAGYENDEAWLVNAGIAFVAVEAVTRFFDLFWAYLPRSAAFIVAGALVLGVAWGLERQRAKLLRRMAG